MKRHAVLLIVCISFICGCNSYQPTQVETKTYDTPLDSMYAQCSDLKGIGMFEIGMPWSAVINSKTLKISSWDKNAHWYNGHWGVKDFEMQKWLISKHPEIKQYNVEVTSDVFSKKYALGDIEFNALDLAFYKDKLVAAYFVFGYNTNKQEILNNYIKRYGEGIGEYYSSRWSNGLLGDDYACDITVRDNRQWKNEKVTLQFTHDERHLSYPKKENKRGAYWDDEYYIVFNEDGLKTFEELFKKAKEEYKNKKDDEHSNALNSL